MARSILLIDDDPAFLRWLDAQLRQEGFRVCSVSNGALAMDVLKRERIHLVITDMRMPFVDGYDVIYLLKELYPETPIVLTTGNPVNERVRRALQFEGVALLAKPLAPAALREAIVALVPEFFEIPPAQQSAA
jgi:CheY-like chemotaxis protein